MPDVAGADGVEADGAGADGVGADGAGAVGCVCASASDIVSIVAGTPKPNAAASPRREKAPRREILFFSCPVSRDQSPRECLLGARTV